MIVRYLKTVFALPLLLAAFCCNAQGVPAGAVGRHIDSMYINQLIKKAKKINDPDSGITVFEGIRQMAGNIGFGEGYLSAITYIVYYLGMKGDFEKAMAYNRMAVHYIRQSPGNNRRMAQAYNNLGTSFRGLGQYDSATYYYYRSIAAQQQYGFVDSRAFPYNNLGSIFLTLSRPEQAAAMFKRSAAIAEQENNHRLLAASYYGLGCVYLTYRYGERDSFSTAAAYLNKSLQIARQHHFQDIVYNNLSSLGVLYSKQQRFPEAIALYEQSLQLGKQDSYHTLQTLSAIGHTYYDMKDFKKAAAVLRQAYDKAQQFDNDMLPHLSHLLGATYKEQGKLAQAIEYYESYIEANDSLKGNRVQEKINTLRYQYEAARKNNEYIRKELALTRRQALLQRKNTVAYATAAGVFMLSAFGLLYFRYRRRIERQTEKQQLEIAAWRASLEGEEKERRRLARELHDNIGGNLSTVKMWLDNIRSRQPFSGTQEKDMSDVLQLVTHTLTEVRNTAHHLMPELLLRFGLTEAVRIFCLNVQKASGIEIQFHYFGYIGQLGRELELVIYRTVQELVQNMAKHSGATSALVQMSMHDTTLSVTVEDNGKGITADALAGSTGMGLQTVRTAVEHSGGQFTISSEPGNGTTVEMEFKTES